MYKEDLAPNPTKPNQKNTVYPTIYLYLDREGEQLKSINAKWNANRSVQDLKPGH